MGKPFLEASECPFKVKWLWRMKWQPTAGFLPGKSHGQRGLADNSPWRREESGMT